MLSGRHLVSRADVGAWFQTLAHDVGGRQARDVMRCGRASSSGAELCLDGRCLQSGIWRWAKGVHVSDAGTVVALLDKRRILDESLFFSVLAGKVDLERWH